MSEENPKTSGWNPFKGRSRRCKIITVAVVLVICLAAALLGWGIHKAVHKTYNMAVILPLYIYPFEGAWDPLYTALEAYPLLQFLVIVNPSSGPGNDSLNDPNFVREIPRLNSYPNVRTIGYVRTGWTTRNISLVINDVATYASWASIPNPNNNGTFAMNGIFYDEAPNNYTDAGQQFMNTIDAYVKNNTNFGNLKLIVHNPGSIPEDNRMFAGADIIVVFESPFADYSSKQASLQQVVGKNINGYGRTKFAYMVSGLPTDWSTNQLSDFVNTIKTGAQYLFCTNINIQVADIYASFGSSWEEFVGDVATSPILSIQD